MDSATATTVAWATVLFGLVGVFISILVTISLAQLSGIRKQLNEMTQELKGKMDESDHEKQAHACTENLRGAFSQTFQRLDEKIVSVDRKFCGHSHTSEGRIVIGGM